MPTPCPLFGALDGRVKALAAKFVADQIAGEAADLAGFVADTDRLAAFRLLVHAEIEEFLESKAREGLGLLKLSLSAPGFTVRSSPGLFTVANALREILAVSWPFDLATFKKDADKLIDTAEKAINNNNGVKGPSFFQLSIIAGKMPDEVDPSLGASLSGYGKSRGEVAHKSVTRVQTILAPSAEAKTASDLVQALGTYFDVMVPPLSI